MSGKAVAKARTRDSMQEVAKLTQVVDGQLRIITDPPLLVPIADLLPAQTDREAFLSADQGPAGRLHSSRWKRTAAS